MAVPPNEVHVPAPFQQEGNYRKVVADESFLLKIIQIGIPRFFEHLSKLVGPDAVLSSSWCLDMNVVRYLEGVDVLPREHLTCVDKGVCMSDIECIGKLVGRVNSENLIVATQDNVEMFSRVARLPVLSYNSKKVLVYCEPSPYQLSFAKKTKKERKEEVLKEARIVYKQVRKAKQHKRKN